MSNIWRNLHHQVLDHSICLKHILENYHTPQDFSEQYNVLLISTVQYALNRVEVNS